jgi:hypothetical protein
VGSTLSVTSPKRENAGGFDEDPDLRERLIQSHRPRNHRTMTPRITQRAGLGEKLTSARISQVWSVWVGKVKERHMRLLRVSVREYRDIEAGIRSPSFATWDRICKL